MLSQIFKNVNTKSFKNILKTILVGCIIGLVKGEKDEKF